MFTVNRGIFLVDQNSGYNSVQGHVYIYIHIYIHIYTCIYAVELLTGPSVFLDAVFQKRYKIGVSTHFCLIKHCANFNSALTGPSWPF